MGFFDLDRQHMKDLKYIARDEEDLRSLEEASKLRDANKSRRRKVPKSELVKDILRVANDPDNPFHGTCSRARYRKYGWFSEAFVVDLFGNHQEFQRAAGLLDSRIATQYKNRRARLHTEEGIHSYIAEEILPYEDRFDRKNKRTPSQDYRQIVVASDWHGEYTDPFTADVFFDVVRRTQPDVIALNGDIVDFPAVSRWAKDPRKILNLQQEIDFVRKRILERTRRTAPEAQIDWIIGNHEYRLVRFLADAAPALCSLRCLRFSELFDLEKLQINLVFGNNFLAPDEASAQAGIAKNWAEYWDTYVVTHGIATGKHPSSKEISSYGMSGTSGHVHRPQMFSMPTLINQYADWLSAGMMAQHACGEDYVVGPTKWTNGFVFATVFPEERIAIQVPVIVKKGRAVFAGKIYKSKS